MAIDYQEIGTLTAAILGPIGVIIAGAYSGKNNLRKTELDNRRKIEELKMKREEVEEDASRKRIEQIAKEASDLRRERRESEIAHEISMRDLRDDRQRGWDLARYHFATLSVLSSMLIQIFQMYDNGDANILKSEVGMIKRRFNSLRVPLTLEEPLTMAQKIDLKPKSDGD